MNLLVIKTVQHINWLRTYEYDSTQSMQLHNLI